MMSHISHLLIFFYARMDVNPLPLIFITSFHPDVCLKTHLMDDSKFHFGLLYDTQQSTSKHKLDKQGQNLDLI